MNNFIVNKKITISNAGQIRSRQNSYLNAFFKFENFPFIEESSGEILKNEGTQMPIVETGAFGNGCRFRPQSRFSVPIGFKNTKEFSCGFWLKPVNILPTVNPSNGEIVYYRVSLFDKAAFSYSGTSGLVTVDDGSFVFYEECKENNKNSLKIILISSSGEQVLVSTPEYDCDVFHHFWIVYDGNVRNIDVFIDGIYRVLTIEDGSIPSSLNVSANIPLNFNISAVGYSSLLRTNTGLLDELVIVGQSITDISIIGRIINYGAEFFVDETLLNREEVYNGFSFDDPTVLQVNAIFNNGTKIYAGRSDGSVFCGDRLLWRARKDFFNIEEQKSLKTNLFTNQSQINLEDGVMVIKKASVLIR